MTKPKRQPKNFFRYFVDEFILFRRDFCFESGRDSDEIAWQLRMLNRNYKGHFNDEYRLSTNMIRNEAVLEVTFLDEFFDSIKQHHYTLSAAKTFVYKRDDEITIVEGWVKMVGGREWFFLIIFLILGSLGLVSAFQSEKVDMPAMIIINLIWILIWIHMYMKRNHLYKLIQSAVENAEKEAQSSGISP